MILSDLMISWITHPVMMVILISVGLLGIAIELFHPGFGCIFLGMETLQWLAYPLKERGVISWLLGSGQHPVITGILFGTILTAILQSGSATIAIAMGFYASGVIPLTFSIAIVMGSNIGTCVTGFLATFGTNIAAKQVAVAHLLLNIVGVCLFAPFIPMFGPVAYSLSNDPAQQLAHIQTLFNVICSLAILPFARPFANSIERILPNTTITAWKSGKQ